jgi:hypothetical protein
MIGYALSLFVNVQNENIYIYTVELEGTVKMCSSYRKFEPPRSRNFREKKSSSDLGRFHYAFITDTHYTVPWTIVRNI